MTVAFEKNGITIVNSPLPSATNIINNEQVILLIGNAPFADDQKYPPDSRTPVLVETFDDLVKLDQSVFVDPEFTDFVPEGISGFLPMTCFYLFQYFRVPIYVIRHENDLTNELSEKLVQEIVGGIDESGNRFGIQAFDDCPQRPTIIAAPGFSQEIAIARALALKAEELSCRVALDGKSTTADALYDHLDALDYEQYPFERTVMADPIFFANINVVERYGPVALPPSVAVLYAMLARKPWESPGNVTIPGALATTRPLRYRPYGNSDSIFSQQEVQDLNESGVCAIASTLQGDIRLIGNRAVEGNFISLVGLRDVIFRTIEPIILEALSKNMTLEFIEQQLDAINNALGELIQASALPSAEILLDADKNTEETLRQAKLYTVLSFGSYRPLEHLIIDARESAQRNNIFGAN